MTTKQMRHCACSVIQSPRAVRYCSLFCLKNDPLRDSNVTVKLMTPQDMNDLPNDITHLTVYTIEREETDTISEMVTKFPDGTMMLKNETVNNIPVSIEEISIYYSEIAEDNFRMPYGSKIHIREVYANKSYAENYDVMAHLFVWRRYVYDKLKPLCKAEGSPLYQDKYVMIGMS